MDLLRQGLHFRGLREFDRQNFGKAYEAFKLAGNYRDSIIQMAEIIRLTSQSYEEMARHYWDAYDAGDKGALPWLCQIERGLAYESKNEHPRFKEITTELDALRVARDPNIAREFSRFSFVIGEITHGLKILVAAVLLGDPQSRVTFSDLLVFGRTSPSFFEVYKLMLDRDIFDFEGFPFEPELIPLSSSNTEIAGEELEISDEMSKLLFWLYDQGDSELRTPGLLMRRLMQEMRNGDSYDVFIQYHKQFTNFFGFKGGIWTDITFIFHLVENLIAVSKSPDLSIYEYLVEKYGVRDLFDEMVDDFRKNAKSYHSDQTNTFTYTANFSLESAKTQIPIDYQSLSIKSFINCVDNVDFDKAQEIFSKVLTDAKSGIKSACLELVNLLEFTDRLRFDFDVLPKKFITFAFDSVMTAIKDEKCELLRSTLIEFKPNGERPYFMDDLELDLLGITEMAKK